MFVCMTSGQTPDVAEMNFLMTAVKLDTYGVDPHPVKVHTHTHNKYVSVCLSLSMYVVLRRTSRLEQSTGVQLYIRTEPDITHFKNVLKTYLASFSILAQLLDFIVFFILNFY